MAAGLGEVDRQAARPAAGAGGGPERDGLRKRDVDPVQGEAVELGGEVAGKGPGPDVGQEVAEAGEIRLQLQVVVYLLVDDVAEGEQGTGAVRLVLGDVGEE